MTKENNADVAVQDIGRIDVKSCLISGAIFFATILAIQYFISFDSFNAVFNGFISYAREICENISNSAFINGLLIIAYEAFDIIVTLYYSIYSATTWFNLLYFLPILIMLICIHRKIKKFENEVSSLVPDLNSNQKYKKNFNIGAFAYISFMAFIPLNVSLIGSLINSQYNDPSFNVNHILPLYELFGPETFKLLVVDKDIIASINFVFKPLLLLLIAVYSSYIFHYYKTLKAIKESIRKE